MNTLLIILAVLVIFYLGFVLIVKRIGKKWSANDLRFFDQNWKKINALSDQKHAIMEADKLLDQMLKKRGYQGSHGEKLKKASKQFSDVNAVWAAHKVRNKLAHELDYQMKTKEFQYAIGGFRKAFHDLKLL